MSAKALARSDQIAEDNRNRIWTAESRRKLSEAKKAITTPQQFQPGPDNPAYKHGVEYRRPSASILIRLRRGLIEKRGFKCEKCGTAPERQNLLHMHHVDDDTFNNAESNLQLLCVACHNRITHST